MDRTSVEGWNYAKRNVCVDVFRQYPSSYWVSSHSDCSSYTLQLRHELLYQSQ